MNQLAEEDELGKGPGGFCTGQVCGRWCYVLFNVVKDTEAGSADASGLELVDSEVPAGESDGDALYALLCTPLVPCPDSLYGASPYPP